MPSAPRPDRHPRDQLARGLSLTDATMLVVSSVIGSGIFFTPAAVARLLPSASWILAAWLVGGVLSTAGAIANAELGAMFPYAGGDYVYLRAAYHPLAGFLVGWLSFFVIYVGSIATLAVALAEGITHFVPLGEPAKVAIAIGATVAASIVNYVSVRAGTRLNNVTAYCKIAALAAFVIAGPLLGAGSVDNLRASLGTVPAGGLAAFGLALSPVLFTYLGWNAPVYVAGEIERPARTLPLSLFLGLGVCTALYLATNAVYLYARPVARLSASVDAGQAAAHALFGPLIGSAVAAFVLISIVGTLNAMILVGPRIAYAMALDGLFFGGADRVHAVYSTPHRAVVIQALATIALLAVLRSFPSVLDYTTFAIVLATMADTAALYTLRRRAPDLPRPYRAWGYPLVPALYLIANGAIAAAMLRGRPLECGIGLGVIAAGLPFYWLLGRRSPSAHAPTA
jgi:basic amino acid/polyamine antiporter, APA family